MKLFSILIICVVFLTGCGEFSGNHYLFYGTITNKQERIKYIEIEENTYNTKYSNEDTYKLLENSYFSKNKNTYSTKEKKLKPVIEFTYTVKLRDGRIVTITQDDDDGSILSINQRVAVVYYYPSGSGKVIPISYNSSNGSGRVTVPYGSTGDNMIIEV